MTEENKAEQPKDNLQLSKSQILDKYLAESAEVIYKSDSATRIRFDGASEKIGGVSDTEMKDRIAAVREAYDNVGVIGNIIDLMVDFALEDFTIVHQSKAIQNFYVNWARHIGLYWISEQILKGIYRDSNVPVLAIRGIIKQEEADKLKKSISKSSSAFINTKDNDASSRKIPVAYKILDVLRLDKEGSDLFGSERFYYNMTEEDIQALKNPTNAWQREKIEEFKQSVGPERFEKLLETAKLEIDPERLSMLYYKKDSYRSWANPMLWRVMSDVKFKKLLRDMDVSVAEGVCNVLTFVKLGDVVEDAVPDPAKFAKMASLLKNPSKSKIILWDNLVDVKSEYPPIEKILGKEKYEQVDNDIRSGCGIPEVLINGGGGNYSESFLSVKTLLERLETGRNTLLMWLNAQMIIVAKAMGFRKPAWVKMRYMNLSNEDLEKRLLLELLDRNMVSYKTIVERFGENFEIELERMKEEDLMRKDLSEDTPNVLLKIGKFSTHIDQKTLFSPEDTEVSFQPTTPSQQGRHGDKGGRPVNTPKKLSTVRRSNPQGRNISSVSTIDPKVFHAVSSKVMDLINMISDKTEANKLLDDDLVMSATIKILATYPDKETFTEEDINSAIELDLATEPAKLDRCVNSVKDRKVATFKETHKRAPNKKEMADIVSSAWAICRESLGV